VLERLAETGLTFFIDYKAGVLSSFLADVQARPGAERRMLFFDANLSTLWRERGELWSARRGSPRR
jgi:hypothetical protein